MHIQIIQFNLKEMSQEDYEKLCDQLAPSAAGLPGLISKVWLANPAANAYGGVYTWQDRQAMENFTKTELFKGVATHPKLANITSMDFSVMEGPTAVTRGLVTATV